MRATRWARHALLTLVSPMVAALVPSHLTLSPNDWLDLGAAPASRNITLIFALQHTPAQRSIVDTHFRAAVEPGTPAYGQFVSTRDIRALVEPDAATLMAVRSVLPANAPLRSLGDGDFLETELTHMAASQLLSVPRFHVYEHVYHRVRYTRPAKPPQLPSALAPHVAFVGGATHLPSLPVRPTRGRTRTAAGSQPSFRPKAKVSTFVPTRAPIRNVTAARRRLIPSAVPAVPPVPGKRRYIPFANPIPWRGENITILAGLRCQDASFPSATHDCVDEYAMRTLHIILSTHTSYAQRELKLPDTDIYYSIDGSQFWADVKTNKMVRQVKIDPYCMPCSHWQGAPFVDGVDVHALCVDLIRQQTSAASPPDQLMCLLRFARPDLVGYKVRITGEMYYQYTEPYPNSVSMHCIKDGRHKVNAAECSDIFTPQPLVSASSLRAALSLPSVQRGYSPLNAQALVQVDNGGKSEGSGDTARSILDAARADVAAFDRVNRLPEAKMILSAVDAPLPKAKHLSSGAKLSKSNLPRSAESIEAAAGLEVMSLLSPSVEAWYWHIRGGAAKTSQTAPQQHLEEEPLLQWLLALSTQHAGSATTTSNGGVSKRLPWVQVLLYTEPESLLSREFTDRINTEFQKAALRGFTIVVSSGADGAPGSLLKRGDGTCSRFEPEFPATSPYVTSVGTTAEQRVASSLGRRLRGDSKGPTQAQVIAEFKRIQQESEKGEIQQVPGTNPSHSQNDGSVRNRSAGHNAKAKSKKAAVAIQSSNKFEQELEQKALANAALNGGAGVGVGAAVPAASAVAAAAAAAAIPASTWRLQTVVSDASLGVGISSGGGFSTRYRRAAYQQREVSQYLSAHPTLPAAMFNESGRAFPDIAMPGLSSGLPAFAIRGRTGALLQGDTAAAAAPAAFGALISQLNDVRLQRGQPPLGFLNPLLYRLSRHVFGAHHLRAFVDVTEGENRCSSEPSRCCVGGFPAARGWDAATGLGIPNFTAITLILTDDACFGIECGGGVCSQGRCVCYNGHGYDAGGRCVPLKPFPKKLIMQVAALSLAGTFFLVQLLRCLYGCCCAKREGTSGKHNKRGCLSRCFTCLCMCCPFELALEPADDEMANRAEMMPIGSSASARAQGTEYLSGSGASGYSSVDPSSTGINAMSAPTALDDFESVNVSQSSQKPAMGTSDVSASGFGSNAGSSAPASNCEVCNVCFLALPQHEVWCPYYKGEDAQNTL